MPDFITRYKPEWDELEKLVKRARRSVRRLTPDEISRLDRLYRRTTVHMAQVATRTRDALLLHYLNGLTAAAHSVIYLPPRQGVLRNAWNFIIEGFARAVARTWRYHVAAALLMLFGAFLAYFAVLHDPVAAYALMPKGEFRLPGATRDQLLEVLRHGRDTGGSFKFIFASFLFTHNLKVGLLAMATGVLAAVPTILLVVYNGMILGAFTGVHHANDIYAEYWSWILPHGVTELWAVVLCSGAGLRLGHAVISPGLLSLGESLRRQGLEAARISLGVAGMLIIAAIIESYLRQSHLSIPLRFVFSGVTLLFWLAYFKRGALCERRASRLHSGK